MRESYDIYPMYARSRIDGRGVVLSVRRAAWRESLPFWRRVWAAAREVFG